jgi:hypothetical protein
MHTYVYTYVYTYVRTYIDVYTHTHTHIHVCLCMCLRVSGLQSKQHQGSEQLTSRRVWQTHSLDFENGRCGKKIKIKYIKNTIATSLAKSYNGLWNVRCEKEKSATSHAKWFSHFVSLLISSGQLLFLTCLVSELSFLFSPTSCATKPLYNYAVCVCVCVCVCTRKGAQPTFCAIMCEWVGDWVFVFVCCVLCAVCCVCVCVCVCARARE